MNTFYAVVTERYNIKKTHFFNSLDAVLRFIKFTREGWDFYLAEWEDGELILSDSRPLMKSDWVDEEGGVDAYFGGLEVAA